MTAEPIAEIRIVTPVWTGYPTQDTSWEQFGLCRANAYDLHFPDERASGHGVAKRMCRACPVAAACREYAVVGGEKFGIWGGIGPAAIKKRRARRRRTQPQPAPCGPQSATDSPAPPQTPNRADPNPQTAHEPTQTAGATL